jgi:hypothetical protein
LLRRTALAPANFQPKGAPKPFINPAPLRFGNIWKTADGADGFQANPENGHP